jgi:hypothetical protein
MRGALFLDGKYIFQACGFDLAHLPMKCNKDTARVWNVQIFLHIFIYFLPPAYSEKTRQTPPKMSKWALF